MRIIHYIYKQMQILFHKLIVNANHKICKKIIKDISNKMIIFLLIIYVKCKTKLKTQKCY